jgi:pentatricopeptide repeat protein
LPSSEGSYNVIVRGFLQHKNDIEAVQLIREMSDKGFVADGETGNLMLDLFVKVM